MTVAFRHGNLGAATTDITSKVRQPGGGGVAWTLTEAAEKGAPAMSGFATEDPAAAVTLVGLKEVHAEDTASADPTIFAGFFDVRNVSRAQDRGLVVAAEREWDATTTDLNTLLGDHIIDSGKRPAETDIERIDWLLGSGYLPIGDAGFIDRSSPTALPEADYTGRYPSDVLAECSNLSGLNYFVRWEQAATFPDDTSPWAPAGGLVTTYVPSVPGSPAIPSSLDVLGGSLLVTAYVAAASVYASASSMVAGGHFTFFGPSEPDANTGAYFGFGLYVIQTGGMTADGRWVWDLAAAGSPRIATVGVNHCARQLIAGYPGLADWSVEVSDDGTHWTTLFDQAAITAATAGGGAPLTVARADSMHRYWSLHMTFSEATGDWASQSGGFLLWSGSLPTGPGPALGYHAYNWSGDESGCAISNVLSEQDGITTFGPSPGDKLTRNPGRVYSGCWFEYSGGHVYMENGTTEAAFRHRDVRSSDMNCQTAAAATALATAYLARCASEEDRIVVNIDNVPASSLGLMRPGQRIPVHLSHVPDYTSGAYMAIMRRSVTAVAAGTYKVQMELSNPVLTGFQPGTFLSPSLWSQNIGQVVTPATVPADAVSGQRVPPTFLAYGNGSTALFTVSTPYIPGSLLVYVDAQPVEQTSIAETDPAAGTFTLDFAAAGAAGSVTAEAIAASWQVA